MKTKVGNDMVRYYEVEKNHMASEWFAGAMLVLAFVVLFVLGCALTGFHPVTVWS